MSIIQWIILKRSILSALGNYFIFVLEKLPCIPCIFSTENFVISHNLFRYEIEELEKPKNEITISI